MNDKVKTVAEMFAENDSPDILFWVGCAGSFDQRAQKITGAFVRILNAAGVKFAVLGSEENCTGDPARRAGNEFLFQMLAQNNIAVLNNYQIKKIVTACPHCFNIFRNEYPALGGNFDVVHHTTFIQQLIDEGKLKVEGGTFKGKKITYHDSCFLGRANDIYEAPRQLIEKLDAELVEMKSCKSRGLCCGAGGAQFFKESEPGKKEINVERIEQVMEIEVPVVASACPYCNTMLSDGVKNKDQEEKIKVYDVAELIALSMEL